MTCTFSKNSSSQTRMSQSVTTLTNGGNGVLTRRSEFNIGIEDQLLDLDDDQDNDDDDRDLTLGRPETGFHIGTARKVNGTSERSASGGNKNKKHFNFFQNKGKTDQQKEENISVSKTPRRVERSKSELGNEQSSHKKLIPHLNQGKADLSETNKKILAHWNSGVERGMKLFQYGFAKTKWEEQQQQKRAAEQQAANDVTSKMSTLGASPMNKSCDGIQQSLQNVLTLKKHFDAAQIFSTLTLDGDKTLLAKKNSGNDSSTSEYLADTPDDKDCLEKYLELDHGEFQFIDDSAATLTRGVSPPSSSVPMTKNLSISSLASEIFQELGQSGIGESSPKPEVGSSRFRHHHQRRQRNLSSASMSAVPMEITNGRYEMSWNENGHQESSRRFQNNSQIDLNVTETAKTKLVEDGTYRRQRRQRNLSSASMSAVVLADETSQFMTSSWNGEKENVDDVPQRRPTFQNDSQLVASLIADQTLFLRHHQKRKQQRRRQQQWSVAKYPLQSSKPDEPLTAAGLLQQQLVDQASQQLLLRRCSSLTQTYSDDQPDPDTSGSTRSSVLIPDRANENGSTRLSSPSKNIRFLYSGKYRPTFQQDPQQQQQSVNGNNNHGENNELKTSSSNLNQSPWLLTNNLSSFARRRRSSSTSLHTYEDDFDDNCQLPNNNKKLNNGDNIPDYR